MAIFCLAATVAADGPPAVRRVRVPASKVGSLLPAGAERRGMTVEAFEALVSSATEGSARLAAGDGARLLRARHSARWEAGALVGRTELRLRGPGRGAAQVGLDPWSPAILDEPGTAAARLRSTAEGRLGVVVDAGGPETAEMAWELLARPGTDGACFALALPRSPVAGLSLDLPAGWAPRAAGLTWRGPLPGPAADRRLWEADGAEGPIELRLQSSTGGRASPGLWVEGTTRVDVAEGGATWRADWAVDVDGPGTHRLRVEVDPGLGPVEVSGPSVVADRVEGPGRLVVVLSTAAAGPTPVSLRAVAAVPEVGPWSIPSAMAPEAGWTGGETVVRVGPGRVVQGVQERNGRRAATPAEVDISAARLGPSFVFVAQSPGPVAELTFRRPWADASASIRGRVEIGPSTARLEGQVSWVVDRGRLTDPAIDLPEGWVAERVQVLGLDEPTTWHAGPRPGGGTRVVVTLPTSVDDPSAPRVVVGARHDGVGPIDLPRLRPVGARVAEELWTARPEAGLNLRPIAAEGLAWVDTEPVGGLAWRWTSADGSARVERRLLAPPAAARGLSLAAVGPSAARLAWSYRGPRPEGRTLRLGLSEAPAAEPSWRLLAGAEVRPIEARRLPPDGGPATWELTLPSDAAAEVHLVGEASVAWSGEGAIPLLVGPAGVDLPMVAIAAISPRLGSSTRAEGLRQASIADARRRAAADLPGLGWDEPGPVHAFADSSPTPGRLSLRTWPLADARATGFIREARLHTEEPPGGPAEQTLSLEILSTAFAPLDIELPEGSTLRRASAGDVTLTPRRAGRSLRFDLTPGPRSLTLRYRTPPRAGGRVAERPIFSMPCLALAWSVGGCIDVLGVGGGLTAGDPSGVEAWPHRLLGTWPGWGTAPAAASTLASRPGAWGDGSTLGERVMGWSDRSLPLLVDRLALAERGLEPSRDPGGTPEVLGLSVYGSGGLAVLTTREQADRWRAATRADRSAVARAALDASHLGRDEAGRLVRAADWAGEVGAPVAVGGSGDVRRYVAPGWPVGARVEVVGSSRAARRWAGGLATLGLGLGLVRGRRRSWAVGLVGGLAMLAAAWGPGWVAPWASGVTCGALALVAFGLGRRARVGRSTSSVSRSHLVAAASTLLACGLVVAADDRPGGPPIVALLPYDDLAELESPARRVVLLGRDHDRLKRLADTPEGPPAASPRAVRAAHRLKTGDGSIELTTELEVDGDGPAAGGWTFPIGGGRDLRAEVDGRPAPIRVLDGGERAEILPPAGRHRLTIRRAFDDAPGPRRLPINPVAASTLVVEGAAPPEVLGARGRSRGDRLGLGPVDHVTIRRGPSPLAAAGRGLVLWDALPVGDLARTRWTIDEPRGSETVRLGLEPGWSIRSMAGAGLVEGQIRGTADRPVWVGRFDPPLPAGSTVAVDLWRPARDRAFPAPSFELLDVERASQLVGLRRRADWQGRMRSAPPGEPIADEEFLNAWGALPADSLTFAGASRAAPSAQVSPRLGPEAAARTVRPTLAVEVVAGKVEFRLAAEVVDRSARLDRVELLIAPSWTLTRVDAPGLTDWSRPAPNRLLLRFDGPSALMRAIRVEGWQPVPTRPLAAETSSESVEVPWPSWPEAVELPGDLAITAPASASARLSMGAGVSLLGESSGPAAAPTRRYRVEGRGGLGPLRWSADPRRVAVSVRSELTLGPGSAEWRASARYEVSGGGCDTIALTLPRAWAEHARLDMPGGGSRRPTVEVVGELATWTIRLDTPFWGSRTVQIRAARPLPAGTPVEFPRLSPLGEGRVDIDLALAVQDGLSIPSPTTVGLVPALDDRFPAPPDAPAARRLFHVQRPDWSLRIDSMGAVDDEAHVRDISSDVQVLVDGTAAGTVRYRVEPGTGRQLTIGLPGRGEVLAVLVDGVPSRPTVDRSGKVVVGLDPSTSGSLQLLWSGPDLVLPTVEQAGISYRLNLSCGDRFVPEVVGATRVVADRPAPAPSGPDLGRLREVGRRHAFEGRTGPGGRGPTIALRPAAADRVDARAGFWLSIVLAASAAAFVPIAARALERRPLLAWAGLGALPTAAWLGVDPLPLVGALGLFLAGRSIGR